MTKFAVICVILAVLGTLYLGVNLYAWDHPETYTELGWLAAAPAPLWPMLLFIIAVLLPLGTVFALNKTFGLVVAGFGAYLWAMFLLTWLLTDLNTLLAVEGWL